jgi:hypothetical protein
MGVVVGPVGVRAGSLAIYARMQISPPNFPTGDTAGDRKTVDSIHNIQWLCLLWKNKASTLSQATWQTSRSGDNSFNVRFHVCRVSKVVTKSKSSRLALYAAGVANAVNSRSVRQRASVHPQQLKTTFRHYRNTEGRSTHQHQCTDHSTRYGLPSTRTIRVHSISDKQ